jgi:phage terminase small subunit
MPALPNPRHERYAQLIVEGLANGEPKPYSQSRAYIAAGYTAKELGKRGGSAQAASSRLLFRVIHRVRELQQIAARNAAETAEKMARELNEIQYEARADKAHAAAVAAVLGKAKVLGITVDKHEDVTRPDFNGAQSMSEIGRKLLQSIGFASPDDISIEQAIRANDKFIAELEAIRDAAQGLTIDQDA